MSRPRGRPRKSDDPATRDRLLAAAAEGCVEVGFDAVTVAAVAARAGVTSAAVYNHFADKDELLYTAGRLAIDRLRHAASPDGDDPTAAPRDVVAAFLAPSFADGRRLILELHRAGGRHEELAGHLADWHREFAALAGPTDPAVVKTFFALLLGLCHVDDLDALDVPVEEVRRQADHLVDALFHP